jgi:hypothetical protein
LVAPSIESQGLTCRSGHYELYSAKRIEFAGGKVYGLEGDSAPKTLLCYTVKSIAGTYRDMVALLPISKIDFSVIEKNYENVLKALTDIGLEVVSISTDGHSANMKFFQRLCKGTLAPSIPHKFDAGKQIHLLFDPVHLFKNYYTNFLNRGILRGPIFGEREVLADFNHVKQLYHHELKQSLKVAYKITHKVLTPRLIERCNVMLAERLFHESTIAGLRFYSQGHPKWISTADFLEIIHTWWSIMNVRTPSIGHKRRDDWKKPIDSAECQQVTFMKKFTNFMQEWQTTGEKKEKISRETLLCAVQTSSAIPSLVSYLLNKEELTFLLLGKLNSDAIERRFGHYRQLAGANYFHSVR